MAVNPDETSQAAILRKASAELPKLIVLRFDNFASAIKTDRLGRSLKRTEHQHNATVFFQMRDGFDPAARQVSVNDRAVVQNSQ